MTGTDQVALRRDAYIGTNAYTATGVKAAIAIDHRMVANAEVKACHPAAAGNRGSRRNAIAQHTAQVETAYPVGGEPGYRPAKDSKLASLDEGPGTFTEKHAESLHAIKKKIIDHKGYQAGRQSRHWPQGWLHVTGETAPNPAQLF